MLPQGNTVYKNYLFENMNLSIFKNFKIQDLNKFIIKGKNWDKHVW